ncbi:9108_t:CDS:2, partial [Dentiscutata erythropus]
KRIFEVSQRQGRRLCNKNVTYLQQRIKQKFPECRVAAPPYPMTAIACKAVEYGLDKDAIKNRVIFHHAKDQDGYIEKFHLMAKRGVQVEKAAQYCDDSGMCKLGEFIVDLQDAHLGTDRPVTLYLCFGAMEIIAIAKNETNGKVYRTTFKLDL